MLTTETLKAFAVPNTGATLRMDADGVVQHNFASERMPGLMFIVLEGHVMWAVGTTGAPYLTKTCQWMNSPRAEFSTRLEHVVFTMLGNDQIFEIWFLPMSAKSAVAAAKHIRETFEMGLTDHGTV